MFVPIDLWTQTANIHALTTDVQFVSGVWHLVTTVMANVFALFGGADGVCVLPVVLPAWVWLWLLTAIGAWAYWRFLRKRWFFGYPLALFIWGVVFADAPFVLLVLAIAEMVRILIVRHYIDNEIVDKENPPPIMPIPFAPALSTFALAAGLLVQGRSAINGN